MLVALEVVVPRLPFGPPSNLRKLTHKGARGESTRPKGPDANSHTRFGAAGGDSKRNSDPTNTGGHLKRPQLSGHSLILVHTHVYRRTPRFAKRMGDEGRDRGEAATLLLRRLHLQRTPMRLASTPATAGGYRSSGDGRGASQARLRTLCIPLAELFLLTDVP